jgi:PPM family protein phosphatase
MQSETTALEMISSEPSHTEQKPQFSFSSYSIASERHPERNEDTLIADKRYGLAAVFDGVGGSIAGEVASQLAASTIKQGWKKLLKAQEKEVLNRLGPYKKLEIAETLEQLIVEAHEQIRSDGAQRHAELAVKWGTWMEDQATTVALAVFEKAEQADGYRMIFGHVGDSRIYLYREQDGLKRLTVDDSVITELVEMQQIDETQALHIDQAMKVEDLTGIELACFQQRNGITQALGDTRVPEVHVEHLELRPKDRILLCTDGIHDNLTDAEIEEILRKGTKSVAKKLVESALQRSRQDLKETLRAKADDMSAVVITYSFA